MFLNTTASVVNWNADNTECGLVGYHVATYHAFLAVRCNHQLLIWLDMQVLDDNLLMDFVELPEACGKLSYCQLLCGVIRGTLEMVRDYAFAHINELFSIHTAKSICGDTLQHAMGLC